jgi:hypothetical protein
MIEIDPHQSADTTPCAGQERHVRIVPQAIHEVVVSFPQRRQMSLLKQARISRGWSQPRLIAELRRTTDQQLPQLASMKVTVSRWENGHQDPGEFYGPLLCEVYSVSAEELGIVCGPSCYDMGKASRGQQAHRSA